MTKLSFSNKSNAFYTTLKTAVEEHFSNHQLKKTGNWKLYAKTGTLIPVALLIYCSLLLLFRQTSPSAAGGPQHFSAFLVTIGIVGCGLLGISLASIGFNVMHDALHGSYSSRKWVNDLMGLTLNALGGNAFIWKFKHNVIHHTYTNVDGLDDDIAKSPFMRSCTTQKWKPAHRYQHIYVVLIYALSSFLWVSVLDFVKYFGRKVVNTPLQKMDWKEHGIFWLSKVFYALFYVVLPVYFVGWQTWLFGFAAMHLILGFILAIVFQLAHVVESTEFAHIEPGETIKLEEQWAIHQIKTTANFAPRNKIISWYVGGLNFQVEHHLFPRISHIHYPAINRIVRQTCADFGISYNEYPTMARAIVSHFRTMRELGRKPA
jgi:linoleoyl-CoA desaturase